MLIDPPELPYNYINTGSFNPPMTDDQLDALENENQEISDLLEASADLTGLSGKDDD